MESEKFTGKENRATKRKCDAPTSAAEAPATPHATAGSEDTNVLSKKTETSSSIILILLIMDSWHQNTTESKRKILTRYKIITEIILLW